jgi:polar amino acid transport system permease protein
MQIAPVGGTSPPPDSLPVRRRLPLTQIFVGGATIVAMVAAALVIGRSQAVQWSAIPAFMIDPSILGGLVLTGELTAGAMVIGIALGSIVAAMAVSNNIVLTAVSSLFVWCYRGVPLIVQIVFWYNIALFVPDLTIGSFSLPINDLVTPAVAGLLALGLHEAANMSEIIRGGVLSVDVGQHEACRSLGLTRGQALWGIVLPQAIRIIIPPTGNQVIGMLKASAIVSVIGMEELLTRAQHIYARNFLVIELLIVASLWYLIITSLASLGQRYLERRFSRGHGSADPGRPTVTSERAAL